MDELRRFIQENPQDPMIDEARILVTQIEFRNAKKANTRYAYQAFLERHSESSQALDARRKLEEMDFYKATRNPTPESLGSFLKLHPTGRNADKARRLREKLLCDKLLSRKDPDRIRRQIAHHNTLMCSQRLQKHLRSLELKAALDSEDIIKLQEFIDHYPDDPSTKKARQILLEMQVKAFIDAGLFDRAKKSIVEYGASGSIEKLLRMVHKARFLWRIASFDPNAIPSSTQFVSLFKRNKKIIKKLRQATQRLRTETDIKKISLEDPDPRVRWLAVEHLACVVDEKASDILFELLGDSFLEVRTRAYRALPRQVNSLGPIRSKIWLASKLGQLRDKARFGPLLLKYAVVLMMLGDSKGAYLQLRNLNESQDEPDIFALAESVRLAAKLGLGPEVARNARNFSIVAERFAKQRISQWSNGAMLAKSPRGWLTLRQAYGVINIWSEAISPFGTKSGQQAGLSSLESILGPWLKKSRISLERFTTWLHDEENRWSKGHPGYISSLAEPPGIAKRAEVDTRGLMDLQTLAVMASSLTGPTIVWASCCHPNKCVRTAARIFRVADNLVVLFQLFAVTPMIM